MTRLVAEDLVKRYRGRAVVNGVSLHLNPGEVIGLLGPNGAGKTTTFYMMAGLVPADQGRVTLGEHDLTDKAMHTRARLGLGYLAQEPSIFRRLTVAQNIIAILETRAELDRSEYKEQCDKLLHEFSIRHLRDNMAISLSGGERRRLEIARSTSSAAHPSPSRDTSVCRIPCNRYSAPLPSASSVAWPEAITAAAGASAAVEVASE